MEFLKSDERTPRIRLEATSVTALCLKGSEDFFAQGTPRSDSAGHCQTV
jgi:hypothetical protein